VRDRAAEAAGGRQAYGAGESAADQQTQLSTVVFTRIEASMFTKIMMWVSIVVVLLTLLGLPVTTETILVETLLCVSGLLVVSQAIRARQFVLATGFLPIIAAFSPVSPIAVSGSAFVWLNWIGLAAFLVAVMVLKTERTLSLRR